jgi:DNA-binding MarR family transcriptional regulator
MSATGREAPLAAVDSWPALRQHGACRTAAAETPDTPTLHMAERFTKKQGQCLAFVYHYSVMFGQSPAEADLQRFFWTSPPTIHQMLVTLAEKQLISRTPGQARSIRLLVNPKEIPRLELPQARES